MTTQIDSQIDLEDLIDRTQHDADRILLFESLNVTREGILEQLRFYFFDYDNWAYALHVPVETFIDPFIRKYFGYNGHL